MKLAELLRDVPVLDVIGSTEIAIAEVRDDSRAVAAGDLFVAIPGLTVDGHHYLAAAAEQGAVAVVVERAEDAAAFPGTRVVVASSARALALIASRRFGDPARAMKLIGVTGTNGKTTTTHLVESMLLAAGKRPGILGTIHYRYPGASVAAPFTTPTPLELHRVLAEMRAAGVTHVVLEASSHALALGRLDGLEFRVGAFTNLTQDHLDFHGDMERYFAAKALLLRRHLAPGEGVGVVLVDGEYGRRMASQVAGERLIVSLEQESADIHAIASRATIDGLEATLASPLGLLRLRSRLLGNYNLANLAVAAGIGVALGLDIGAIERGLSELPGVPGRFERVVTPPGPGDGVPAPEFAVLVDYAHTHDALENVLAALRPLTTGRLVCVFGCGGDRDKTKRPRMGHVVARDADIAIVTSDNPRTEDPAAILAMILAGVAETGAPPLDEAALASARRGVYVEADRRRAIAAAVAAARPGDVVLIAGKGHEDYQIIGKTRHPFDDRLEARDALARLPSRRQS